MAGVSNVNFRRTISKGAFRARSDHHDANEHTPLLAGGSERASSSESPLFRILASWAEKIKERFLPGTTRFLYIALIFLPIGLAAGACKWHPSLVLLFNLLPLPAMIDIITLTAEDISIQLSPELGGLLNALFDRAAVFLIRFIAVDQAGLAVANSFLIGSVLSSLLCMTGLCFLFGGLCNMTDTWGFPIQLNLAVSPDSTALAQVLISILFFATLIVAIPSLLDETVQKTDDAIRGSTAFLCTIAAMLLLMFIASLVFELYTHARLYDRQGAVDDTYDAQAVEVGDDNIFPLGFSVALLVGIFLMMGTSATYLMASLDGFCRATHLEKLFVGAFVIPLVCDLPQTILATRLAVVQKMDLAMPIIISNAANAFLVETSILAVVVSATSLRPGFLFFSHVEILALFLSFSVVTFYVIRGASNYVDGVMCLALYAIFGVIYFFGWAA